ncbi:M20/M25/M40 family metallo-hydrolase [uncultured Paenalcaligenes sp.]|uniref:M20/M25/M40 family metallo-hydrolase n=1 Tax=uncultured Paenalcaligenes sp. TaxID=1588925 RepID=UPI00260BFF71|nr:M20/M25/M40 family metallo-hydrolase [uncultured Paenalcaligenes sp.]
MTPQKSLLTELYSLLPEIQGIRQRIHAHPELGFQELATAALVADYLRQLDIEVHEQVGKTGVVGVLRGTAGISARSIGLRADMDALPIHEQTQLPYQSTIAGQMHACGHDGHTAVLLATAAYLAKHRDFAGIVHFMLRQRPGAYFRLGQGGAEQRRVLHNANFDFNDAVIPQGAAMFVRIAQNFLAQTTTTTLNLG